MKTTVASRAVLVCAVLLLLWVSSLSALDNVFQLDTGYISGMKTGDGVVAFLGIPYAKPPTGDLRFRPPQKLPRWDALYEAVVVGPACLQPPYAAGSFYPSPQEEQSEDCLYLNVWTGADQVEEERPVMVWIHGGALTRGSGANPVYDGTALAKKGVVVVTLNYRLGAFGYLAHPALTAESENESSGNYAVLDQIAALEWVKRNISLFGGDPNRVTIFGESAGSWSVNALMATPLAKGLFHRAIGQSGGLFGPMATLSDDRPGLPSAEKVGKRFVASLGVDSEADAATLRKLPAEQILEASVRPGAFRTRPVVDGWVFPEDIYSVFAAGKQADVPVLVGSTQDEATTLFARFAPKTMDQLSASSKQRFGDRSDQFAKVYPVAGDRQARQAFLDSMRDEWFTCEMRTWARMTDNVSSKAFLYRFTRVPPGPESEQYGAYHASEILYVFNNLISTSIDFQQTDRELADAISSVWVSFAEDGNPSISAGDFPPYDAKGTYLELGDVVRVGHGLAGPQCDFLDSVQNAKRAADGAVVPSSGGAR